MDNLDIIKLAGQGGFALAVLGAFVWLIRTVGISLVGAMRDVGRAVEAHTKEDLASHARLGEQMARVESKFDTVIEMSDRFTPVGVEIPRPPTRAATPARGVQIREVRRGPTRGEGDR